MLTKSVLVGTAVVSLAHAAATTSAPCASGTPLQNCISTIYNAPSLQCYALANSASKSACTCSTKSGYSSCYAQHCPEDSTLLFWESMVSQGHCTAGGSPPAQTTAAGTNTGGPGVITGTGTGGGPAKTGTATGAAAATATKSSGAGAHRRLRGGATFGEVVIGAASGVFGVVALVGALL